MNIDIHLINLEEIKNKIEKMSKLHHIEILKILKKNNSIKLNENKSGVFVNLSFLPKKTIEEIVEYINYIVIQENSILELETQTNELKKHISYEKENKDNLVYNNI